MAIEWAPLLDVPLHRRLEVCAAAFQILITVFGELISLVFLVWCLYAGNIYVRSVILLYLLFVYYDRETGDLGGRGAGSPWVRNWLVWKYFLAYFPANLIKTAELPPNQNYLFAIFPHGVLSTAVGANFNNNYSKWHTLFPGIRAKVCTLGYHMVWPIFREMVLGIGMASASARSISTLLTQSNDKNHPSNKDGFTSNAVMLMVGGAQEALHSRPNNFTLVLKERKGFVKIALRTGSSLVPVFSFGELDLYDQVPNPPGSRLRYWQEMFKRITGVAPIVVNGRGIFQYSFGFVPRRRPLNTVVGAPIKTEKRPNPTPQEIDELHTKFCQELNNLFEKHKRKYIPDADKYQIILE